MEMERVDCVQLTAGGHVLPFAFNYNTRPGVPQL